MSPFDHRYTREEAKEIQPVDLTIIKLAMRTGGVFDGHGRECNPRKIVEDFDDALHGVLHAIKEGTDLPEEFVVPDFWHIALGDAASVPKEEGKRLWEAAKVGLYVGRTFYETECTEARNNYPGSVFYKPLAEPHYKE